MFVRLALANEVDEIICMSTANAQETLSGEFVDPDYVRHTFKQYLDHATSTFFVVEDQRKVIAFLQAYMFGYDYRAGLYTVQKVLYVKPEKRGSRAAVLLMKELVRWSKRLGADRIEGGNDNGFKSERTAKFLGHFGFENVGFAMRLNLENHHG
jgi:GNAT superfamily N-acetyltransferase